MFIYIPNKKESRIIVIDTEYSEQHLIQFSSLLLQETTFNEDVYQLVGSANVYVKPDKPISYFTTKYTGLTNAFIRENGVEKKEFHEFLQQFLSDVNSDAVIVAHGIRNDLKVLRNIGIDFQCKVECTLEMSKKILGKATDLRLVDIAQDAGLILNFAHHSYSDAVATLAVYSFLKTLEAEEKKMKFLNTKDMFISEGDDYNVITFDLEVNDLLEQKLDVFIDKMADHFVEIAKKIKKHRIDNTQKYFFEFKTDLNEVEDLKQVASIIGVMLFKSQLKKKRKVQLAYFKLDQLGDIAITQLTLGDLLKNKSFIKYVNYSVLTKDEKLKFYMIGADDGEDTDS